MVGFVLIANVFLTCLILLKNSPDTDKSSEYAVKEAGVDRDDINCLVSEGNDYVPTTIPAQGNHEAIRLVGSADTRSVHCVSVDLLNDLGAPSHYTILAGPLEGIAGLNLE